MHNKKLLVLVAFIASVLSIQEFVLITSTQGMPLLKFTGMYYFCYNIYNQALIKSST